MNLSTIPSVQIMLFPYLSLNLRGMKTFSPAWKVVLLRIVVGSRNVVLSKTIVDTDTNMWNF